MLFLKGLGEFLTLDVQGQNRLYPLGHVLLGNCSAFQSLVVPGRAQWKMALTELGVTLGTVKVT